MNELQNRMLDIIKVFISICNNLNIEYFGSDGTCLGAVRHNGFIPWDDDADFVVPRKDYNYLKKHIQEHLPSNYRFICFENTKNHLFHFAKIVDLNSPCIEKGKKTFVWIDVFPLDGIPDSKFKRMYWNFVRARYSLSFHKDHYHTLLVRIVCRLVIPFNRLSIRLYDRLLLKYSYDKTRFCHCNYDNPEDHLIPSYYFDKGTNHLFESVMIRIPAEFDNYLTLLYGDWRKPPKDLKKGRHDVTLLANVGECK